MADKYSVSSAQIAAAWAIAYGTTPILGVIKLKQVEDAAQVSKVILTKEEVESLERIAKASGVDTRGGWEDQD